MQEQHEGIGTIHQKRSQASGHDAHAHSHAAAQHVRGERGGKREGQDRRQPGEGSAVQEHHAEECLEEPEEKNVEREAESDEGET